MRHEYVGKKPIRLFSPLGAAGIMSCSALSVPCSLCRGASMLLWELFHVTG